METLRFEHLEALWLLWSLPAIALVFVYSFYRKRCLLRRFADQEMLGHINQQVSKKKQVVKAVLLGLAVVAIILGLTQPGWNPTPHKVQRQGRDVVVLLDVSRSMLAEDLQPSRLAQAKLAIGDLISELEGDRIGIIAFAGTCVLKCPLTQDYGFARMAIAEMTPKSITQGGTKIGDAIRLAVSGVFDQQEKDFKDIILITDGEDHDSAPIDAAGEANKSGIRIFAIGLGNPRDGSRIPITAPDGQKTYLEHEGQEVWSKLNEDNLRKIVMQTPGGLYLPVATGTFDLAELYRSSIMSSDKKALESTTVLRYDEKFQILLALALILLVIEAIISERTRLNRSEMNYEV
ncbi:MAG: VWA domain-containing protein [Phycisphaerae bacterium]|nr:VWA domain-containing protein [Phycisphaerae bacterium]